MSNAALFLGFPINDSFALVFEKIDAQLAKIFISKESSDYLQEIVYQDVRYLGKFAGQLSCIGSLALLENNIYSLLMKIVPDYPCKDVSLVLFPILTSDVMS